VDGSNVVAHFVEMPCSSGELTNLFGTLFFCSFVWLIYGNDAKMLMVDVTQVLSLNVFVLHTYYHYHCFKEPNHRAYNIKFSIKSWMNFIDFVCSKLLF
jgi:hypothetical protein